MNKLDALDEACEFVKMYMDRFDVPIPLHYLNRRFGVRIKEKTGSSLKALLQLDDRFSLILMQNSSTSVAVIE